MEIFNIQTGRKTHKLLLIASTITFFIFILPQLPTILEINRQIVYLNFPIVIAYHVFLSFLLLRIYSRPSPRSMALQHLEALGSVLALHSLYLMLCYFLFDKKLYYDESEIILLVSTWGICMLIGYVIVIAFRRSEQEKEIERLKLDYLQSRCEALANQINPHFFFNSLSSIAALIRTDRKDDSLKLLDQMGKVFHYVFQVNKDMLVTLEEEISFLNSYRYMLEIRYGDNITFDISIPEDKRNYRLPALSLLPLVENVIKHNRIDSRYPMTVTVGIDARDSLFVSNPMCEKLEPVISGKVGLSNLSSRYNILINSDIVIASTGGVFSVVLPLIKD